MPPPDLSPADLRLIQSARARIIAGGKPTAREQAAIDRQDALKARQTFLDLIAACPRDLFTAIAGEWSTPQLRAIGERLSVPLAGKTVDVAAVLKAALPIVAAAPSTGGTAHTYQDLAARLGMSGADSVRQLKAWTARGMPGRPGSPGRRDGAFPVDECRAWIATHTQTAGLSGGDGDEATTAELRKRLLLLELEIREREKLEQLGRLADVGELLGYAQLCVNNAKAIFEAIPDEVLALLDDDDEAKRRTIHRRVTQLIDTGLEEWARMAERDTDPTDNPTTDETAAPADAAETGPRPVPPRRRRSRQAKTKS